MAGRYVCARCEKPFVYSVRPSYCPGCGGQYFRKSRSKAEQYAKECLTKCQTLRAEVEARYRSFMDVYVEYEDTMQVLRVYKGRGIVAEADMPTLFKPKLAESLKEHRRRKYEEVEG